MSIASGPIVPYSINKNNINTAGIAGATVKVALLNSGYTPNTGISGDQLFAAISANEIANGNGYTTGGLTLGTVVSSPITGGYKLSSANPVWNSTGSGIPAWRYAVFYIPGSFWSLTGPLLFNFLGDLTGIDVPLTPSGFALTIGVPANGYFDVV